MIKNRQTVILIENLECTLTEFGPPHWVGVSYGKQEPPIFENTVLFFRVLVFHNSVFVFHNSPQPIPVFHNSARTFFEKTLSDQLRTPIFRKMHDAHFH